MSTKNYINRYYEYIHLANGTKYHKHAHCAHRYTSALGLELLCLLV